MGKELKADWFNQRKTKDREDDQAALKISQVSVNSVIQVKPRSSAPANWWGVVCVVVEMDKDFVKVVSVAPDRGRPTVLATKLKWDAFVLIGKALWLPLI